MRLFNRGSKISLVVLSFVFATFLESCSSDKKKSKKRSKPNATTEEPDKDKDKEETPIDPDVGEKVPPIKNDDGAVEIETGATASMKHLIVTASDKKEEDRHLSEFLLLVRASSDSCIRLKVRPSSGITDEVSDENLSEEKDLGECKGADEEKKKQEEKDKAESAALTYLDFTKKPQLGLLATAPSICSKRLFRMPTKGGSGAGESESLEKVITKTGRFLKLSADKKVRIWVDEEVGTLCSGANPLDQPAYSFGYLSQINSEYASQADKLTLAHIENVAEEASKALKKLTDTYGPVSDIDASGTIDIFISPDVNRTQFQTQHTSRPDSLRAKQIYKPQDLANYNSNTNPSSNEGEILYLWAPDPGGIYRYGIFPTSDSLTGNFAKGYLASQIMTLIFHNSRLLERNQKTPEDYWLISSIAHLAASYIGGNSYPLFPLEHYLTSRPQKISLTEPLNKDLFEPEYVPFASDEQNGLRTLFGWYLHTRLCGGKSVEPCPKIKDIVTAEKRGIANIQEALKEDFSTTLENFGASIGVALAENAKSVLDSWDSKSKIRKPNELPQLTEISKGAPPQTVENTLDATALLTGDDRAITGPFPNKTSLLFQPILPDNDFDIKLVKNSVTPILLTGIVTKETDITAFLGPNLNVVVIPLGDRDPVNKRRVHMEKRSEAAHLDLRPINLTNEVDTAQTNYAPEAHPGIDYTITQKREVWILGSIDNFTVSAAGGVRKVSDTDAYTIKVDPCAGASDETACRAIGHKRVIVQMHARDHHKQLNPILMATTPSLTPFRGHAAWGTLSDIDDEYASAISERDGFGIPYICPSDIANGGNMSDCAAGGVTAANYNATACADPMTGSCAEGYPTTATGFNALTYMSFTNEGPLFDNYLHSWKRHFPFYTHGAITYPDAEARDTYRMFNSVEANRQFIEYKYHVGEDLLESREMDYYPVWSGITGAESTNLDWEALSGDYLAPEDANKWIQLKNETESAGADGLAEDDPYVTLCVELGIKEENCINPLTDYAKIETEAKAILNDFYQVCLPPAFVDAPTQAILCPEDLFTNPGGGRTTEWMNPSKLFKVSPPKEVASVKVDKMFTYYDPIVMQDKTGYCGGDDVPYTGSACEIRTPNDLIDLRQQFYTPANKFDIGCTANGDPVDANKSPKFLQDFFICADNISYLRATDVASTFYAAIFPQGTARVRTRSNIPITMEAGEVIGKPGVLNYLFFYVPTSGATTINLLASGIKNTQGKYLIRARIWPYD